MATSDFPGCDPGGNGDDCAAVCADADARHAEDELNGHDAVLRSAECADTRCACVVEVDGRCDFAGRTYPCTLPAAETWRRWVADEQALIDRRVAEETVPEGCTFSPGRPTTLGGAGLALLFGIAAVARRRERASSQKLHPTPTTKRDETAPPSPSA